MKKTTKRNGFTVVELVIVIAVIAVLAGVMIPVFSGVMETAHRSNDTSLVANINTILTAELVLSDGINDAVEVQKIIKDNGLKLETKTKGQYLWYDIAKNQVVLGGLDEYGIVIDGVSTKDSESAKGKYKAATSPEGFVDGYLFISEGSRDGFADKIYALRNPNGADLKKSIDDALKDITAVNGTLGANLREFMTYTAVMTKDQRTVCIGDSDKVVRVIVSSEMKTITVGAINDLVTNYPQLFVVDLHSGVVDVESIDAIVNAGKIENGKVEGVYFVYNNAEIKEKDDNILNLISGDERSRYITTLKVVRILLDKNGNPVVDQEGKRVEIDIMEYPYKADDNKHVIKYEFAYPVYGTSDKAYEFASYSFFTSGAPEIAVGTTNRPVNEDEQLLIEDGTLKIYALYQEVVSDFKWNGACYGSAAMTYMLATGKITSGTITVTSTSATLGDANHTNLEIPSDVTLHLPYEKDDGSFTTSTAAKGEGDINNSTTGANKYNPAFNKFTTPGHTNLTIPGGVTLLNEGTIYVDAQLLGSSGITSQCYINDVCAVLVVNGTLKTKGDIKAYGVVRGEGEIVAEGGTVTEVFTILDWGGGTSANNAVANNVTPFHNWKADNIRVKMTVYKGVEYAAFGSVNIDDDDNVVNFALLGPDGTSSSPLFLMKTGAVVQKTYEEDGYHLTVMAGEVVDGKKTIDITIQGMTRTIDFSKIALPLPAFDITVKAGAKITLNNNLYKVLPGSDIVIEEAKDGKAAGEMVINTTVAFFDVYDLKMIPQYKVGDKFTLNVLLVKYEDTLVTCTYTDKVLTVYYDHYERELWNSSTTKNIKASCSVQIYPEDRVGAPLTVNGKLVFGEKAVFTGEIVSNTVNAEIEVKAGAKFANSKTATDINGNDITIHGFTEGLGFTTSKGASIDIGNLKYGHWQQTYADGVALIGTFHLGGSIDAGVQQIPTDAATYTYNGSVWTK